MATTKTRINMTVSRDTEKTLRYMAKKDKIPVATKAVQLLQFALEIEEDKLISRKADARYTDKGKRLTHKQIWRK